MKRKIYALLLSCAIATTLGACGGDTNTSSSSGSAGSTSASTASVAESTPTPEATETPTETQTATPEPTTDPAAPIDLQVDDGSFQYLSYEILEDYDGNPLIMLHFNFTNNSDQSASAQTLFYPQVFQNGVECEFGFFMGENAAYDNLSKEVQPGTTLEVGFPYTLQDTTNPVTVEAQAMTDMFGDPVSQVIEIAQ